MKESTVVSALAGIPNVLFPGFVQKPGLPRWYGLADVLVVPILGGPYGHVVQEAMAAGAHVEPACPGVYRVGDTRDIFSDISKLSALGWEPRAAQVDMVREYLAWVVEQPGLHDTFTEAEARMRAVGVLRRTSCAESGALAPLGIRPLDDQGCCRIVA